MLAPSGDVIERIRGLPPLGVALEEVLSLLDNGVSDWPLISKHMLKDPVLSGRVLQLANSSFYGMSRKVKDVEAACVLLGANTVRNLVYSLMVMGRFKHNTGYSSLNYDQLWQHNVHVGCLMKLMAKTVPVSPEIAFMVGLFHNLGLIVQDYFFPEQLHNVQFTLGPEADFSQALAAFHTVDKDYCYELLTYWKFPQEIVAVFSRNDDEQVLRLRRLMVCACCVLGAGSVPCAPLPANPDGVRLAAEELALEPEDLQSYLDASAELYREMAQAMLH